MRRSRRRRSADAGRAQGGVHAGEENKDKPGKMKEIERKNLERKSRPQKATSKLQSISSSFYDAPPPPLLRSPILRLRPLGLAEEHLVRDLALPVEFFFRVVFFFEFCFRRRRCERELKEVRVFLFLSFFAVSLSSQLSHLVYCPPALSSAGHGLYALIGHHPNPGRAPSPPMIRPSPPQPRGAEERATPQRAQVVEFAEEEEEVEGSWFRCRVFFLSRDGTARSQKEEQGER